MSPADKIAEFFSHHPLHHCKKGKVLLLDGDEVTHAYYLVSGTVKQYGISPKGDEMVLNIFKPPAFFPMSYIMNNAPARYIFETETEASFRMAPAQEIRDFLEANPDVVYDLLSRIYRGIDGIFGRLMHLSTSSARDRLLYELTIEAQRFGTAELDGSTLVNLTEKDLGARAGLSRETVNREIKKLKAEGLITVHRSHITIPNLLALKKLLDM